MNTTTAAAEKSRYPFANPQPNTHASKWIQLVNNAENADVKFTLEDGSEVYGHKVFLAAASPIFEAMFSDPFATGSSNGVNIGEVKSFSLLGVSFEELVQVFRCAYADVVDLNLDNLQRFFELGIRFHMVNLLSRCIWFLERNVTTSTIFQHMTIARAVFGSNGAVDQFVEQFSEAILHSNAFLELPQAMLCQLISKNTFFAQEHVIFERVVAWAQHQLTLEGKDADDKDLLRAKLSPVLAFIRFPLMDATDLADKVVPGKLLPDDELRTLFMAAALPRSNPTIGDILSESKLGFTAQPRLDNGSCVNSVVFWDVTSSPLIRVSSNTMSASNRNVNPSIPGAIVRSYVPLINDGAFIGQKSRITVRLRFAKLNDGAEIIASPADRGTSVTLGICRSNVTVAEVLTGTSANVRAMTSSNINNTPNNTVAGPLLGWKVPPPKSNYAAISETEVVDVVLDSFAKTMTIARVGKPNVVATYDDTGAWYLFVCLQRLKDVVMLE